MLKTITATAIAFALGTSAQAAIQDTTASGNWTDMIWDSTGDGNADNTGDVWTGSTNVLADQANIQTGHTVTVNSDDGSGGPLGTGAIHNQGGTLSITSGALLVVEGWNRKGAGSPWDTSSFQMDGGTLRLDKRFTPTTSYDYGIGTMQFDGGSVSVGGLEDQKVDSGSSDNTVSWIFSGGALEIDIEGLSDHDVVSNTNVAAASKLEFTSSGILDMDHLGSFTPSVGDSVIVAEWDEIIFDGSVFVDGAAQTGTDFWQASVIQNGASSDGGTTFDLDQLQVSYVPEPASLALLGLGGLCMLGRRQRSA
jgi:hypothetical protein